MTSRGIYTAATRHPRPWNIERSAGREGEAVVKDARGDLVTTYIDADAALLIVAAVNRADLHALAEKPLTSQGFVAACAEA